MIINCKYKREVAFYEGLIYKFPDFTIEYLGMEKINVPEGIYFSPYADIYKITDNSSNSQTYRWSPGTGLLFPLRFSIEGQQYEFEPYKDSTKVKRVLDTKDWEIFGFVILPNMNKREKVYVLRPVIRDKNREGFSFMLNDPTLDVTDHIKNANKDLSTVSSPTTKDMEKNTFLSLQNPLDYNNHKHLFLIMKDELIEPTDKKIVEVGLKEDVVEEIYNPPTFVDIHPKT